MYLHHIQLYNMKIIVAILSCLLAFVFGADAAYEFDYEEGYGTILVRTYGAIPDDGNDDTQPIRSAIAAAIATNMPQIILFEAGQYDLDNALTNNYHVRILNGRNIILRGVLVNNEPATRLVRYNSGVENAILPFLLHVSSSKNITVENFIFDNDPYYYSAGVVTAKSGSQVTVDILPGHPMTIVKPYIMGAYDMVNGINKTLRITWDTDLPTWAPIAGGSGRLMRITFSPLATAVNVGDGVFWFQGNHGATQCVTNKSSDITFNNVVTHNSTGFVYHFVDNENIALNRVKIVPTGNRIAVAPRDGIHFAHNRGFLLLDSVTVRNVPGDDGFNAHGEYVEVSAISSKTITFAERLVSDLRPGSRIQFLDNKFQPAWTGTVESANPVVANNVVVTVVLKETPPSWVVVGTLASPLGYIAKGLVIRNSIFENTGRFGVLARVNNVVIDSSRFRFNAGAGVALGSNFNEYFQEAQNPWNVVVKNSFFQNNLLRFGGDQGPGGVFVDQFFVDNLNAGGNLFLFKNTFLNETHAYNLKDAMNIHLWGNVYNSVTTPIWRNLFNTYNFTQGVVYNDYVTNDSMRGAIYYSGTWPVSTSALDSMNSVTWNDQAGAYAEFHFIGNRISYFARRAANMGMVDVYLDDQLVLNDFDLYAATAMHKSLIYSNDNLTNTVHTLRIVNTGLRNANATGGFVNIDYLVHRLGDHVVMPTVAGGILPVKMLSFDAYAEGRAARLVWSTTNEVNNSHFDVRRFNASGSFESIGRVNASSGTGAIKNYSFVDAQPFTGINYYQLQQFDLDGKSTRSKTASVNFGAPQGFSVFPNPVKLGGAIKLKFAASTSGMAIKLLDMNERVVRQRWFSGAQQYIELPTIGLNAGVYVLKVESLAGNFSSKIVITP
jgi:hypothetical protein